MQSLMKKTSHAASSALLLVATLALGACGLLPQKTEVAPGVTQQTGQFEFALPSGEYRCERGERLQLQRGQRHAQRRGRLAPALERARRGDASVIPVLLRAVDIEDAPFAHLQGLPTDLRPVTSWPNRDEAWTDVAKGIRRAVEAIRQRWASAPPPAPPPPASATLKCWRVTVTGGSRPAPRRSSVR